MTLLAAQAGSTLPGAEALFAIVITLAFAAVLGTVMHRMGQSVMVGYLLAGIAIGPGALGLVRDVEEFALLGEVGVALLLFTIGLELPWQRMQRIGIRSFGAGALQIFLTIVVAVPVLLLIGLEWPPALAVAMAISLSSTAVVMRLLVDRAEIDSVHGLAALAVLLAQDLAVVGFLLVVPQLGGQLDPQAFAFNLGWSVVKLIGLILAMYVVEFTVMRRLFRKAVLGTERELLALTSIVISLGAVGAADYLGLSAALGGFVAGLLMADAPYADQVRGEIAAIRAGLMALFFAWIGMLADLEWIIGHPIEIIAVVVAIIVGKAVLSMASLRVVGTAGFAAFIAGMSLAQLGEFSFAIVAAALAAGVVDTELFQLFVSASLVTLLLTPWLMSAASRHVHRRAARRPSGALGLEKPAPREGAAFVTPPDRGHVVVIGYGPSGRAVVKMLRAAGAPVTIVELNPRLCSNLQEGDVKVVFGDATQPEILERAEIGYARMAIVTIPEPTSARRVVRMIADLVPHVPVVARGRYHMYADQISESGAWSVVDEETVTGRELGREALRGLGLRPVSRLDRATE